MTAVMDPLLVPVVHRVLETVDELPGVVTLRCAPTEGEPESFRPGQCGMLGAFGIGEAAISISSATGEASFHDYTIRRTGAITSALTSLDAGDELWVRGPFGTAWDLDLDGRDIVIAAGGIGIAPLRAALLQLIAERERYGRIVLVVGARDAGHLLYASEYDEWRSRGLTVVETIDLAEAGWFGRVGLVPDVVAEVVAEHGIAADGLAALTCGPDPMMRFTAERLIELGADPNAIQLTVERNMQCGNGLCGHCQMGGIIVCRDGPVVRYPTVRTALATAEY